MTIAKGFGPKFGRIFRRDIVSDSVNQVLRMVNHSGIQKDITNDGEDMNKQRGAIKCEDSVCDGNDVVKF